MDASLITNRRQAALVGYLIGEMVGVPYDSVPLDQLPASEGIGPTPPPGMPRGHRRAPQFAWADGGAQVLALLDSLHACGELDLEDVAERLMAWLARGDYCIDSVVFEYGVQTTRALAAFRDGVPAKECGPRGERQNGNGALMRVLPIALWWKGSAEDMVALARRSCLPTHGHALSQLCASLYCLWIRASLNDLDHPWEQAVHTLQSMLRDSDDTLWLSRILAAEALPRENNRYVVNTLWAVRDAFRAGDDWLQRVRAAIRIGDDTDTVAALVGGVSAAQRGLAGIPPEWIGLLPPHERVVKAINGLAESRGPADESGQGR